MHHQPHKWSLATLMLLASGLMVVGICVYLVVRDSAERPVTSGQIVRHNDLMSSSDINYPVLHREKIDTALRAFAKKQTDQFVTKIKDRQYDPLNKLTLKFEVSHHGDQTLSVIFSKTEKIVDKSETSSRYMLTFDVKSEARLAVRDLFREDIEAQKVLANIFYDYFRQSEKAKLTPQQQLRLLDFTLDDVRDFLLFEDTIVLHVNPKDLTNKKKAQAVSINKNVVASVLKDAYRTTDAGRKPETPTKPTYAITSLPSRATPNAGSGGRIALTFDDGPSPHTARLLDILAKYRSRATFYVLGHSVHGHAGIIQRIVNDGSEVGNHTWNHPNLTLLSPGEIDQQIGDTQRAIQQVTDGYTPRTVRPPYGATNDAVSAQVGTYGLAEVLWSVDPNDWQTRDSQLIYDRIMGGAADGRVILLHDIYGSSVDGAIRAIPDLLAQGYQLVTVSELYGY
jgi:peptidoglycan/xylan/chitin deacetylase (PgdA/CDA1 family)